MSVSVRLSLFILALFIGGCSLLPEEVDETHDWSGQKLFSEANYAMKEGDYELAIKYFEFYEARYPFGIKAMQAQLNLAYAYYKYDEPESALSAADRFLKLYPNNPASAYVLYLKGMVNMSRGSMGLFDRFIPTDPSQRDPGAARDAFHDFSELLRRYPDSEYSQDATQRMIFLRNNLARHEIHVAHYYMDRGAYVAAANRAIYVVENYQRTDSVRDALVVMIDAYEKLGMKQLSDDARRVLALNDEKGNFPVVEENTEDKGWIRRTWDYLELDKN